VDLAGGTAIATTHTVVFGGLLYWCREYWNLTQVQKKGLEGVDDILGQIRTLMAEDLRYRLDPVVEAQPYVGRIVGRDGSPIERPGSAVDSEAYGTTVASFLRENGRSIVTYTMVVLASNGWCRMVKALSVTLVVSTVIEGLLAVTTWGITAVFKKQLYDWYVAVTFLALGLEALAIATFWVRSHWHQHTLFDARQRHGAP
jgi:hypothetical protein